MAVNKQHGRAAVQRVGALGVRAVVDGAQQAVPPRILVCRGEGNWHAKIVHHAGHERAIVGLDITDKHLHGAKNQCRGGQHAQHSEADAEARAAAAGAFLRHARLPSGGFENELDLVQRHGHGTPYCTFVSPSVTPFYCSWGSAPAPAFQERTRLCPQCCVLNLSRAEFDLRHVQRFNCIIIRTGILIRRIHGAPALVCGCRPQCPRSASVARYRHGESRARRGRGEL